MKPFRALGVIALAWGAASLGVAALLSGCSEPSGDRDGGADLVGASPRLAPLAGPMGSTGTNNLPPPVAMGLRDELFDATGLAFADYHSSDDTWWLDSNVPNDILVSTDDGRRLLKYAVRCGISEDVEILAVDPDGLLNTFPGQGLLTTTQDWLTTPLTTEEAEDLFTCLLAHLNSRGVEVPINLSGLHVPNLSGADSGFTWEEALWATRIKVNPGKAPTFSFNVWPLDDLLECDRYVEHLEDRVCGTFSGDCNLTIHTDRDSACTEGSHGWVCDVGGTSMPVIKTRLKSTDVELLYDSCP
ncbi:MAG: hypothetical protein R3B70_44900 [Polyangiaceae bacterium]